MPPWNGGNASICGARYRRSRASTAASAPWSDGTPGGTAPSNSTDRPRTTIVSAGSLPRNVKRPHRSACSTDSSRKPDGSLGVAPTSFTNADTGVSRSASTSRHTGTTVWSRASARNSSRDGCVTTSHPPGSGAGTEGPEEARPLAGVAGAAALLLHDEQERVGVAVVVGLAQPLAVAGGVALAPQLLSAAAPIHHAALGERGPDRVLVHPRQHEHPTGALLLRDRGNEPVDIPRDGRDLGLRHVAKSAGRACGCGHRRARVPLPSCDLPRRFSLSLRVRLRPAHV